jgi:uncharacterized protein with PIN domain
LGGFAASSLPVAPQCVSPFLAQQSEMGVTRIRRCRLARQAFLDFGKGRHKAGLNFGDCFAYALARATGEALLFKGDDFALTDIRRA